MKINSAINDAINREKQLGKYLLQSFSEKLKHFEKKHKMRTQTFVRLFDKGELGDEEEYFEWLALYKGKKRWDIKLRQLSNT